MDLLKAVETEPLKKIKKIVETKGIPIDLQWLDYKILNKALECERVDVAKYLLLKHCRCAKPEELTDGPENTPLHYAAELEDVSLVEDMIQRNAKLTAINQQGQTPIHIAFIHVVLDKSPVNGMMEVLFSWITVLKHEADQMIDYMLSLLDPTMPNFNQASSSGLTHLHIACARQKIELVQKLLKAKADVNQEIKRNEEHWPGYVALHFAAEAQCKKILKMLMKKGANIEHQAGDGMTPLHIALHNEDHMKKVDFRKKITVVDILYEAFAFGTQEKNDVVDSFGMSFLHIAASRNDVETVKRFLEKGANVNKQLKKNKFKYSDFSPMHFAARYKCHQVAELLIEKGADVNCISHDHGTPLHLAIDNGDEKMIDLLLKHNANAKIIRPCDKRTVLHVLCSYEIRCDLEPHEKFSQCPEFIMGYLNSRGMIHDYIKKFIKSGVNVNAKDEDGYTALHVACMQLREGELCVDELLKYGADINIEDESKKVAFQMSIDCQGYRMNGETFMKLYHYVQKLKEVGLKVNPKNEKFCKQLLDETDECDPDSEAFTQQQINKQKKKRLDEVKKLKEVKIDEATSLFDVLIMDVGKLMTYCNNQELDKIVKAKGFCKQYPWYGHLIRLQYQTGLEAKKREDEKKN